MRISFLVSLTLLFALPVANACGIHDLVKPNLDDLREATEKERKKEEIRLEKIRQEEEAKRLEEEARLAAIEEARKDPLVDPNSVEFVTGAGGKPEYTIGANQLMGSIASERYGDSAYYVIIEYWNDVKAQKVYVGQVLKTPSIATIVKVKGAKVVARYPEEMAAMLKLREDFLGLESTLRESGGELDDETKAKLEEFYKVSKKIHAGFLVKRPGVAEYATGLLTQCKNIVDQFSAMKKGDLGSKNLRISRVHTSLSYALRNAMIWGQEDFK